MVMPSHRQLQRPRYDALRPIILLDRSELTRSHHPGKAFEIYTTVEAEDASSETNVFVRNKDAAAHKLWTPPSHRTWP